MFYLFLVTLQKVRIMKTLNEQAQQEREQWAKFKKETQKQVYTRAVLSIERDTSIVGQSNFHSWILITNKGVARMTLNKSQNPPQIGSIIEFTVSPYRNSYDKFFINKIVREIPKAGEHYLFELWEREELKKMYANG